MQSLLESVMFELRDGGIGVSFWFQEALYGFTMPLFLCKICFGLLLIGFCLTALSLKKSFFEQCSAAILAEPVYVVRNGIAAYLGLMAMALFFLLSVVGFPIALFFALAAAVFCLLGEISISIWLGHLLCHELKIRENTYSNFLIGVIVIEGIKLIPRVSWVLGFTVLPVLGIGSVLTGILNLFLNRILYELPYPVFYNDQNIEREKWREKMRNLIIGE